jgi:hypothetical protein
MKLRSLWLLLPLAAFWAVFYIGSLLDLSKPNWWAVPYIATSFVAVIVCCRIAVEKMEDKP